MSNDIRLKEVLSEAREGKIILPDFQREFTWKLGDIKSLIASILLNYPIGSILTVEEDKNLFAKRPLLGMTVKPLDKELITYLLDGQQRITSSHLVFSESYCDSSIPTGIRRRWFINMERLGLDNFDFPNENELIEILECDSSAILPMKINLKNTTNPINQKYDSKEFKLYCLKNAYYPLSQEVLDGKINYSLVQKVCNERLGQIALGNSIEENSDEYQEYENKKEEWLNKFQNFLNGIQNYSIPNITIQKGASLEKIARVFETVNKSGMTLTLFELLVARATAPNVKDLKTVIEEAKNEISLSQVFNKEKAIQDLEIERFGQAKFHTHFCMNYPKILACTIQMAEKKESLDISKQAILGSEREKLNKYAKDAALRLLRAYTLFRYRFGVASVDQIPYDQMLIPLAMALDETVWNDEQKINKIEAWYWAAIFSGRYLQSQDQKAKEDGYELKKYILNLGGKPKYLSRISEDKIRFEELKEANEKSKGIYKAVLQYILSTEPNDLLPNKLEKLYSYKPAIDGRNLEDHHIIPKQWINDNLRQAKDDMDSCLNRVFISFTANRGSEEGIFAQNPVQYMKEIDTKVMQSLCIPSDLKDKNVENFEDYLKKRYELLMGRITQEIIELS